MDQKTPEIKVGQNLKILIMKKLFFSFFALSFVPVFAFVSCKKEIPEQNKPEKPTFSVNKCVSSENVAKVNTFFVKNFSRQKSGKLNVDFDLKNIQEITTENNEKYFLSLQYGYDIEGEDNFSIGFYMDSNGEINHGLYIEREVVDESISIVNYYDPDGNLLLSTIVDSKNKECYATSKGRVTGQAVMDCINDLYTKRGWLSVAYWITTAFVPETALVATGGCVIIVAAS
jgi:hypothetical protein